MHSVVRSDYEHNRIIYSSAASLTISPIDRVYIQSIQNPNQIKSNSQVVLSKIWLDESPRTFLEPVATAKQIANYKTIYAKAIETAMMDLILR